MISDTHNLHRQFEPLEGDVLIHCGDMFYLRNRDSARLTDLDDWFGEQKFDLVLCTGGNHDHILQDYTQYHGNPFKNAVYLQDSSYEYKGLTFYGAPWVPDLFGHAYYLGARGLREKWSRIPSETDVLITHVPPAGVLDESSRGMQLGCEYLLAELPRVSPTLHCFGHIHASTGVLKKGLTTFVNAASVSSQIELIKSPYVFDI